MITSMEKLNNEETIIYSCIKLDDPKSFFLFAGAGSGKTRSLVQVLKKFKHENRKFLQLNGQKIAIITYTNAASEEIKRRLEYDSIFVVSTIHSFSWELIKPYQIDIREWLRINLNLEITELEEQEAKGRAGTKASIDRIAKIESKKRRLDRLDSIKRFTYNPNGLNNSRDSLNHAEVLKITSEFLMKRKLMQQILVNKYPILLIDESQDTKRELIEAFFKVQREQNSNFALGLFGDTMQRIYTDGKVDLGRNIPSDWETPAKTINYRCPQRVITLINKIRSEVDSQIQEPFKTNNGFVRLFIIDSNKDLDKGNIENTVASKMSTITQDDKWNDLRGNVKCLTLEHHMAAKRGGFLEFFEPLYNSNSDSTGLLDGTMPGIPFLKNQVLPLYRMLRDKNDFEVANIIRKYSPLLDKERLRGSKNQVKKINEANKAVVNFIKLWGVDFTNDPTLYEVIKNISESELLKIPDVFSIIINRKDIEVEDESDKPNKTIEAWEQVLKTPFHQLEQYSEYIDDKSSFGTHQGVKGLEFPRVMVVLDDEDARGFLFSYEKLLGAKEPSATDTRNIAEGKETSIDRTRRLFYVCCSRAEESLAIVAYTKAPKAVKNFIISQNWFTEEEIILL